MTALLLFLSLQVAAAEPDPGVKDLKAASLGMIESVDRLLSTPVDPARIPALKDGADRLLAEVRNCDNRSQEASLNADTALRGMEESVKGRGSLEALDRRHEKTAARLAELQERLRRGQSEAEALKSILDGRPRPKDGEDESEARARHGRAKDCLEKAQNWLERADSRLKESAERVRAMDDDRGSCKSGLSRARAPKDELARAAAEIARLAAPLPDGVGEFRTRLEAMAGRPDDNETRGRVYPKQETLLDGGRGVYAQTQTAHARAEAFWDRAGAFAKAHSRFEENRKSCETLHSDASDLIDQAEPCLKKARE